MTQPQQAKKRGGGRTYSWPPQPPHELTDLWSVTRVISNGLPKPFLIGWAAKMSAICAVDDHELVGAMLKTKNGERKAVDYIKGARFRDMNEKADRGTIVHAAVEAYVAGKPLTKEQVEEKLTEARVDKAMWSSTAGMISGALDFLMEHEPEIVHSEATVYSRQHGYAGTLDMVARMRVGGSERLCVIDFKTSKAIYDEVALQLAAYANADFVGLNDGSEIPLVPSADVTAFGDGAKRALPTTDEAIEHGVVVRPMASGTYEAVSFTLTPDLFDVFLACKGVAQGQDTIAAARRPTF